MQRAHQDPATYAGDERRVLDRSQPAAALTVFQDERATYWVRAGATEELAHDAADQRRLIALHNLICGHSTAQECAETLRDDWRES